MKYNELTIKEAIERKVYRYDVEFIIKTKAKTIKGQMKALRKAVDIYEQYTDEELEELLESDWVVICKDGIIISAEIF